jgi:hypothetical protein
MNQTHAIPQPLKRIQSLALLVGVVAGAIAVVGLFVSGLESFFQSYLFSYLYWLGITLGSLAFAMLSLMVGGRWGIPARRLLEAGAKNLWLAAALFIPILFGLRFLYPWANPQYLAETPLPAFKGVYLSLPFVILRAVVYFVIWIYLLRGVSGYSRKAAQAVNPGLKSRYQRFCAFGIIIYFLTMTFASIDWIMSLEPEFFSTIFGILVATGQGLSAFALAIALTPRFARVEPLSKLMEADIYRDLGALLLTAVTFWAYLAFSQYLIIWSGNLPREISWYISRSSGSWLYVGIAVILLQFFLPFWVLISLRAKRSARVLATVAGVILAARLLDTYWEVMPAFHPQGISVRWLDVVMPLALGGLWVAAYIWQLERTPPLLQPQAIQQAAQQTRGGEGRLHE